MMKKNLLKAVAALLTFALVFASMSLLLNYRYSDSITSIKRFYKQPKDSVDVLAIGTSHVYEGLSPAVLYREYGIAAYDLCAPAQAVWNSYYYFVEALKTQKPKAVVFDVYMLNTNSEYDTMANAIKTTYGMKWSKNRLHAIHASFPEKDFGTMLKSFYQYHSRYAQVKAADLLRDNGYPLYFGESYKGFVTYDRTMALQTPDVSAWTQTRPFEEKHENYFRDMIELAIKNQIVFYVVSIPYAIGADTQKTVNRAAEIAAEYADSGYVRFIDFNRCYAEMGLDYGTDFSGKQHLNYSGSVKFTSYFGSILKNELNLPDHRGEAAYASWEENANVFYRLYQNSRFTKIQNASEYINALKTADQDYYIVIAENTVISDEALEIEKMSELDRISEKPKNMSDEDYEALAEYREEAKKASLSPEDMNYMFWIADAPEQGGVWILHDFDIQFVGANHSCFTKYHFFGRKNNLLLRASKRAPVDDTYYACEVIYNGESHTNDNGLILLIYDEYLDQLVDCVTIASKSSTVTR